MNLQAIRPTLPQRLLPNACSSCRRDVDTTRGFAYLDGTPWRSFLCFRCASLTLHARNAEALLGAEQDRQRNEERARS